MRKCYIYGLFDQSGIRYIGKALDVRKRYNLHLLDFRRKNHRTNWIKSLLNKELKPELKVLEECTTVDAATREQFWISFGKKVGWNLVNATQGGEGCYGRIASQETRDKLRLANTGKKPSTETLLKLSQSHKGQISWMKGKTHSDVARAKISKAGFGRYCSQESRLKRSNTLINSEKKLRKSIQQIDIETGKIIAIHRSATEAARLTKGLQQSKISNCCLGKRNKHAGFKWQFLVPSPSLQPCCNSSSHAAE